MILLPWYDDNKVLILVFDRLYYPVKVGEVLLTVFQYLIIIVLLALGSPLWWKKTKQNKTQKQRNKLAALNFNFLWWFFLRIDFLSWSNKLLSASDLFLVIWKTFISGFMCVIFVCGQVFNHGAMLRYDPGVNFAFQIQLWKPNCKKMK